MTLRCQWCGGEMVENLWWGHLSEDDAEDCGDPWWDYEDGAGSEGDDGWETFAFILPVEDP